MLRYHLRRFVTIATVYGAREGATLSTIPKISIATGARPHGTKTHTSVVGTF